MTVSVVVENQGGQFCASPLGMSGLRCLGQSREEALTALRQELARKLASGELVDLVVAPSGVSGQAGRFREDPALLEIRDEIYRQRDADRES